MIREKRNATKIEGWRLSRVPVDPTETILQGDLMAWNAGSHLATKLTTAASGDLFCGVSETTNPQETAGSLTSDPTSDRINLMQYGLVEMRVGEAVTLYPGDLVTAGADAQTVLKAGATADNSVGRVDPGVTSTGKVCVEGDPIRIWLTPHLLKCW